MPLTKNLYRVCIADNQGISSDRWSRANMLFQFESFRDYKEAASYSILAAKSTGVNYEISRVNTNCRLECFMIVKPLDSSIRRLGFIELPSPTR